MNCGYCGCALPSEWHPNCSQCGGPTKEPRIDSPRLRSQGVFIDANLTDANGTKLELHGESGAWVAATGEIGIVHDYVHPDCRCAWTEPAGTWEITSNAIDD